MGDSIPESVPQPPIVVVLAMRPGHGTGTGQTGDALSTARALGASDVTVIALAGSGVADLVDGERFVEAGPDTWPSIVAAVLRDASGPVVLVDLDSVVSPAMTRSLVASAATSVVVASERDRNVIAAIAGVPVVVDRGFVDRSLDADIDADSDRAALAMSWLVVSANDAAAVGKALDELEPADSTRLSEVVVPAMLSAGVAVRAVSPRNHVVGSALGTDAARIIDAAVGEVDCDAARIASAVKAVDGPFTTYCVSPYSRHIAAFGARHGWTPNVVTSFSTVLGLAAAACFLSANLGVLALGVMLLISSFVFDCVDGQLARLTSNFSARGAWLDLYSDRVKEFAMIAALALGAGSGRDAWLLAGLTVAVLSVRHAANVSFTIAEFAVLLEHRARRVDGAAVASARIVEADRPVAEVPRRGLRYWFPWLLRFTIGDRLFVVSSALLIGGQLWALIALCVGSVVAMLAQVGLRVLRTRRFLGESFVPDAGATVLNDFGVVARLGRSITNPAGGVRPVVMSALIAGVGGLCALAVALEAPLAALAALVVLVVPVVMASAVGGGGWWLIPTSSRLVDVAFFLAVVGVGTEPWLGVLCVMIVALRHSDLTFRSSSERSSPRAAWGSSGGLIARLVIVIVAFEFDRLAVGAWLVFAVVAAQTCVEVADQLRRS